MCNTLIHVGCLAHILHNCCLRVKARFKKVDDLIGAVKMAIHKNKTNRAKFTDISLPPEVVIRRWQAG
jgi:hypothetical protein